MMIQQLESNRVLESIHLTKKLFQNTNPYFPRLPDDLENYRRNLKFKSVQLSTKTTSEMTRNHLSDIPLQITDAAIAAAAATVPSTNAGMIVRSETSQAKETSKLSSSSSSSSWALSKRTLEERVPVPQWHAPWELSAVISGHIGWVRCIAFDPSNEWFVTGSADRTIKIWDLAKCCAGAEGGLKLTLTGHISPVRGLAVSSRHPYMFSAGEDKTVKCWDLECNKVIRHYHGHLSGVYSLELHPTLDILMTGGRDSVTRVWDMRTKHQIHLLAGHTNTVSSILTNAIDPQVITASHDATIKLWDLAAGKCMSTLTHHKKSVRGLCANPKEMSFISCSADNIKKWQIRDGRFLKNFSGHNSVVNCVAVNEDGIAVSCGDNGSMNFWDYETGYCFQATNTIAQPGSLEAETGIFACTFDKSGSRLLTCEADKSIKIWKENEEATVVTHPIDMNSWTKQCIQLKKH